MKTLPAGTLAALMSGSLALATPLPAQQDPPDKGDVLTAALSGSEETRGGDEDGRGQVSIRFDRTEGELCYDLSVEGVDEPTAAHIHRGAHGEDGPPVVSLDPPVGAGASGCVTVSTDLMDEIHGTPASFYVNVHNEEFPAGAVRGQLSK